MLACCCMTSSRNTPGHLQHLTALQWCRCSSVSSVAFLSQLAVASSQTLQEIVITGSTLPPDPSACWQGLAAAPRLTRLDLSDVGFSRTSYMSSCGQNPTVALLTGSGRHAAVADFGFGRLEVLLCNIPPTGWLERAVGVAGPL